MAKWAMNYETGDFEFIEKDGYSITTGEYTYNWDDSEYRREEEREREERDEREREEREREEREEREREEREEREREEAFRNDEW